MTTAIPDDGIFGGSVLQLYCTSYAVQSAFLATYSTGSQSENKTKYQHVLSMSMYGNNAFNHIALFHAVPISTAVYLYTLPELPR